MPTPAPGEVLNPDKVNVLFVDEAGNETTFGRVADAAACAGGSGWYYDDPADPSTIQLCEATCTTITAESSRDRLGFPRLRLGLAVKQRAKTRGGCPKPPA